MTELLFTLLAGVAGFWAVKNPETVQSIMNPPIPLKKPVRASEQDIDMLARTIWGEARGDGYAGMAAVANVIMTRYRLRQQGNGYPSYGRKGASVAEICTATAQFSAWNATDPNRAKMLAVTDADQQFRAALQIARKAVNGTLPDNTRGADHYHTTSIRPYWAQPSLQTALVGSHVFYNYTNKGGLA